MGNELKPSAVNMSDAEIQRTTGLE